jgi:hypothetical protein
MMILAIAVTLAAADRVPLAADGRFTSPPGRCVRVSAGKRVPVRVNGLAAGETSAVDGALDITGFLRSGQVNEVVVSRPAFLLVSPLVYLDRAESDGRVLRVTVVNTTENTMQVELGERDQFTVSPGTSAVRELPQPDGAMKTVRMRATSDGLDLVYQDEIPIVRR